MVVEEEEEVVVLAQAAALWACASGQERVRGWVVGAWAEGEGEEGEGEEDWQVVEPLEHRW